MSDNPKRSSVMPARDRVTRRRILPVELYLFLSLWLVYGVVINSRNLEAFNLQQAGVEAMVERRQFSLEGSATPQLQIKVYYDGEKPFGDTFIHNGRQYAAKQPGQFMIGAVVYFFLRLFGLSNLSHYTLTAALVTFFTSSLLTGHALCSYRSFGLSLSSIKDDEAGGADCGCAGWRRFRGHQRCGRSIRSDVL